MKRYPVTSFNIHSRSVGYVSLSEQPDRPGQRWAPGAYNPRALGVSLGISGHRTNLVKSLLKPGRDRAQNERELIEAGSGTDRAGNLTERIGLTVSNTRPRSSGNQSESQPGQCPKCTKLWYLAEARLGSKSPERISS